MIEITESTVMVDIEVTHHALAEPKGIGVRIAIDDFGTGYSSLSYQSRFPVDRLKIDQSFVRGIAPASRMNAIVDAIISMSRSLGIGTIAEGVESEEQLAYLAGRGCIEVQGFLFAKPMAQEDFSSALEALQV